LYADDIILMSASVSDLQRMINVSVLELGNLDLIINSAKSKCIRIGPRCKYRDSCVVVKELKVEWSNKLKYLGIFLKSSTTFKCNFHENKANFFRAANGILSKI